MPRNPVYIPVADVGKRGIITVYTHRKGVKYIVDTCRYQNLGSIQGNYSAKGKDGDGIR